MLTTVVRIVVASIKNVPPAINYLQLINTEIALHMGIVLHMEIPFDIKHTIYPLQLFVEKCQFLNQNYQLLNNIIYH